MVNQILSNAMDIKPESLQILATKALADAQAQANEFVNTTQNLTAEALANLENTKEEITTFIKDTPSSMATVTLQTVQEAGQIAQNIRFENLPLQLQVKFARAGVRQGFRDITEATKVFESIPAQVRAQGTEAVREFCQDKDWSHIIAHSKGGSSKASNGIFEHFQINRARGGRNMTPEELAAARSVLHQAAFRATVTQVASAMTKGALIGAAVELVFSILENSLLYAEGKITQGELLDTVKDATVKAGITGAVVTALLVALCLIFPPIAVLLASEVVATTLVAAGIGLMSIRAWDIFCHANRLFGFTQQAQQLLNEAEIVEA